MTGEQREILNRLLRRLSRIIEEDVEEKRVYSSILKKHITSLELTIEEIEKIIKNE